MADMALCDTHCHIHNADYPLPAHDVLAKAAAASVTKIVTLGSNLTSSRQAIDYVRRFDGLDGVTVRACAGVYPHETGGLTAETISELQQMIDRRRGQICGVGEIGLDYCYDTVERRRQLASLEALVQLGIDNDLPMSFHVRSGKYGDAFADFWAVLDNFGGLAQGVLHSFTDSLANLGQTLSRGLYVGVNGIVTFNRDAELNRVYQAIPLERLVLETDAPFLTPRPYRGQTNQPCYIRQIAEYVAQLRHIDLAELAKITTDNAVRVYNF